MDGFIIRKSTDYIDIAKQESGKLGLLVKECGLEIMEQNIVKDKKFYLYPGDDKDLLEFFYIAEGKVSSDEFEGFLTKGDCFYLYKLEKPIFLLAETDVKLLYLSNRPIFHILSERIKHMTEVMTQIHDKDKYTKLHCFRVQNYAFTVAKKLGLDRDMLESLTFASLFHDLGKVEIPDEILNKPGKLTKEEYECIKKHPETGKEIAKDLYYKNIGHIIEQHHERLDGSGYPKGLKGDEILLEARIIAVVDTYDAMTSDRPYRKGLSPKVAINELITLSGIQYDKRVVDAFLEVLKEDGIKI